MPWIEGGPAQVVASAPAFGKFDGLSGNAQVPLLARRFARHRDLARRAVHQLGTGKLLDQIGVDLAGLHQLDAMLQAPSLALELGELLLAHTELGLRILERDDAACAPDRIVAEIGRDRAAHRRQHHGGEHAGHTSPDSHPANESPTDSGRQGEMR